MKMTIEKTHHYRIFTASSREIIWEGRAINPRHARKQAATLSGRSNMGKYGQYITVKENHVEYCNGQTYPYTEKVN